ncbi:MAG: ATP-binding protein [Pseudomonadota bacterium]
MSDATNIMREIATGTVASFPSTTGEKRRGAPLHLKVFLRLAPLVAGVFLTSIAVSAWFGFRGDQAELHDKLAHVISNQSIVLAMPMAHDDTRHIGLMAAGIMADPDIAYARLQDADGQAMLTLGTPPRYGRIERRPVRMVEDGTIITLGAIEIGVSYRGALTTLVQNLATSMIGAIVATLASWVALIAVLNRVVRDPVARLRTEIDTWRRQGGALTEGSTTQGDEIKALGDAFDSLKMERRRHEEALQALLDTLERRVDERTRALRKARDAAERASAAKADFLAAMSHEIRTPMNAILGITHALSEQEARPRDAESLGVLRESGQQLMSLLDEILDLSKIEAGKLEIHTEPTDLRALVGGVAQLWRTEAEGRGLTLEIDVAPDIPDSVMADAVRLRQCLGNLISNAVKFSQRGAIRLRLALQETPGYRHPMLCLTVRDEGPGIDPAVMDGLFEPFVQGIDGRSRGTGGTGLGLAITRRLMRLMGGDVDVENWPGDGAAFTMRFPLRRVPKRLLTETAPASDDGAMPDLSGVRVMVVDDVATNRYVARLLLEPAGAQIVEAASGKAALASLRDAPVDLVLLDLHMPDMDGFETVKRIRALPKPARDVHLVVLTADTRDALQDRLHRLPLQAIMTKPFDPALAIGTIGKILGRAPQPTASTVAKAAAGPGHR